MECHHQIRDCPIGWMDGWIGRSVIKLEIAQLAEWMDGLDGVSSSN